MGWIACLSVLLLSVVPASAGIIAEDSFYTGGGSLNGRNGGSGWAGAWVASGLGNYAACVDATGVSGSFSVHWFDPFIGGGLQAGSVTQVTGGSTVSLGNAPGTITKDRVVLVKRIALPQPHLTLVPGGEGWQLFWTESGFVLEHALDVTGPWTNVAPPAASPYALTAASTREFFRLQGSSP